MKVIQEPSKCLHLHGPAALPELIAEPGVSAKPSFQLCLAGHYSLLTALPFPQNTNKTRPVPGRSICPVGEACFLLL